MFPFDLSDGCSALMMACNCPSTTSPFEKTLDIIKQLVKNGAIVKAINRKRMTALMFAASNGNLKAVEYLLPLSNKDAIDNQRWTVRRLNMKMVIQFKIYNLNQWSSDYRGTPRILRVKIGMNRIRLTLLQLIWGLRFQKNFEN